VTYGSLALARLGLRVRALLGADESAATASELDLLRAAGVDVVIAPLASGPVFDNIRHILHSTSDRLPLTALPPAWTTGFEGLLYATVAAELGEEWAAMAGGEPAPMVGLGWQGLVRHLAAGDLVRPAPPTTSRLARAAQLVVVSREDFAAGTGPEDLLALLDPAVTLVWTEGADGGLVLEPRARAVSAGARAYPAIPSDSVVDPTGAGDVLLAAMLATRLVPELAGSPADATSFAAAAASLTVEGPGLAGVPDLAAVRARMTREPSLASRLPSDVSSRDRGRPSQA
jgi:sugar/nucleoside kinase (ribokinase family)